MTDTANRIRQIEDEIARLPAGYISKKMISGKERFYLQWILRLPISTRLAHRWKRESNCRLNSKH